MMLRHREMRPRDVDECVEIIATHPVLAPRYGSAIEHLSAAWLRLLGTEAMRTKIFETSGGPPQMCFVGISLCVTDEFVRDLKTPPVRWFGPELVRRITAGDSVTLTDRQVRECNSHGGLNLLVWEGCIRSGFETHTEIYREIVRAFLEEHRGFLWKELVAAQAESVERLQWTLSTGGLLWDPAEGKYIDAMTEDLARIAAEPHFVGMTKTLEAHRLGSWVGDLFDYHQPQCGFSSGEQQLLLSALNGATDEELSNTLHVSVATVKKTWLSIYGRAMVALPKLLAHRHPIESSVQRGKEKRRRVLAYVRDHPEELRPYIRKLLR